MKMRGWKRRCLCEKLTLGYQFAGTGWTLYNTVSNCDLNAQDTVQQTMKLVRLLRVDFATLCRAQSDQDPTLEGLQFKAIPTGPVELFYQDCL